MLANKVGAREPRHIKNLAAIQAAYPQLVLPLGIGARDSIGEAVGELKQSVLKMKKTAARKAAQEVRAMTDDVFTKKEIAQ